ncbi:MAG: hypothetical protein RLZZ450_6435 [Pseudomonadota bacterium]|jgi:hypothetical protein
MNQADVRAARAFVRSRARVRASATTIAAPALVCVLASVVSCSSAPKDDVAASPVGTVTDAGGGSIGDSGRATGGLAGQGGWPDWNTNGTFVNILTDSAKRHGTAHAHALLHGRAGREQHGGAHEPLL